MRRARVFEKNMEKMTQWTERNTYQKSYLTYQGEFPFALFRYRTVAPDTLDRLIDFEIAQDGIYLSALKDLNDPDEARFHLRFAGNGEDMVAYLWRGIRESQPFLSDEAVMAIAQKNFQELRDNNFVPPDHVFHYTRHCLMHVLRVACFTTSPTNFSLWANYAKHKDADGHAADHAGICIEYRCDKSWHVGALHPVRYSDDVPEINPVDRNEEAFAQVLYMKSREWRGEEEWRISSVLQTAPPFEGNWQANCKIKIQGAVAAVIFGVSTPQETVEKFASRVKKVRPDIALKRVVRNPLTWVREVVTIEA